jgi:hypothetical protein
VIEAETALAAIEQARANWKHVEPRFTLAPLLTIRTS